MSARRPMSNRSSAKLFNAGIRRAVPVNISPRPMRGGIRL